jgi:hypothetical protein
MIKIHAQLVSIKQLVDGYLQMHVLNLNYVVMQKEQLGLIVLHGTVLVFLMELHVFLLEIVEVI